MSSARFGPIACSATSENRFASLLLSAPTVLVPVESCGVWQSAQPMLENLLRPFAREESLPGPLVDGVGAARNRWKLANLTIAGSSVVLAVTSLGLAANWQLPFSSRSCWNASLLIPISTL